MKFMLIMKVLLQKSESPSYVKSLIKSALFE